MLALIKRQLSRLRVNYLLHRKRLYIKTLEPSTGSYITKSFPLNLSSLVEISRGLSRLYAVVGEPSLGVVELFYLFQGDSFHMTHTFQNGEQLTLLVMAALSNYELMEIDNEQ